MMAMNNQQLAQPYGVGGVSIYIFPKGIFRWTPNMAELFRNGIAEGVRKLLGEGEGAPKDRVKESKINFTHLENSKIDIFVIGSGHAE